MYNAIVARFCIDGRILGTEKNLVSNDRTFSWTTHVPPDTWHLSGELKVDTTWCLDSALKLSNVDVSMSPPERFIKAMSLMSGSLAGVDVPWSKVLPSTEHRSFTERLINDVEVAMAKAALNYYRSTWVTGNGLFKALRPACVSKRTWYELERLGEGNVPAIRSFEPDRNGFASPVCYDRFKTLTGRLTVASGPQILTLKREHRKMIRSLHGKDGTVVALDFAALEARVLLYEHGRSCDDADLYATIAKEVGHDRKAVKGAVISELYGSSKSALGVYLGMQGKELDDFVKKVRTYFNTRELLKRIKQQFITTGKVINRYGRHVTIDEPLDHVMLAYYGQSTGVDISMMGFMQVVDRLAVEAPRVRPVYLLHDAILLDVHKEDLPIVKAIDHVKVPGYVQKFILKMEKVS